MLGKALHNLALNRTFVVTRLIALTGGLMAGSGIYMMRYGLDYGGWLPDANGVFPTIARRTPGSLLIAVMVQHVDVALWQCLMLSTLIFLAAALLIVARALVQHHAPPPTWNTFSER